MVGTPVGYCGEQTLASNTCTRPRRLHAEYKLLREMAHYTCLVSLKFPQILRGFIVSGMSEDPTSRRVFTTSQHHHSHLQRLCPSHFSTKLA